MAQTEKLTRDFAMPHRDTFSIPAVAAFIARNSNRRGLVVDPFARNSMIADLRNDLNPDTLADSHLDAIAFLEGLSKRQDITTVLFDPPYSPRQIAECYRAVGITPTMRDTQNARFYRACRQAIEKFMQPRGVVISFGWNSGGMGASWKRIETLLVHHGGAHNDTICCADEMRPALRTEQDQSHG